MADPYAQDPWGQQLAAEFPSNVYDVGQPPAPAPPPGPDLGLAPMGALLPAPGTEPMTAALSGTAPAPLRGALPPTPPSIAGALPGGLIAPPPEQPAVDAVTGAAPALAPASPLPPADPYEAVVGRAEDMAKAKADTAAAQAVGYERFAERMRDATARDATARDAAQARLAELDTQMATDRDEIRELSRAAAAGPGKGTKAGFLIGGALQALKALLTGAEPNLDLMDQVLSRDAEAKAKAVAEAQRRAGITGEARDDEVGNQQTLDYFKALSISDTWSQLEADLRVDAAAETDLAARQNLETAADSARQRAQQAESEAANKAYGRQLGYQKQLADITYKHAQTRKLGADAGLVERKAARVGRGTGRKKGESFVTESQLRDLPKGVASAVKLKGIRNAAGEFMTLADGSFAMAKTEKEATRIERKMTVSLQVNDLLNKVAGIRRSFGHEWKISNSEAVQAAEESITALKLMLKGPEMANLGVLAGPDLDLLEKLTGKSAIGWFSNVSRWNSMRERLENEMTREMRAVGSKAKFRLQKAKAIRVEDPEVYQRRYRKAYDPSVGTASVKSRFADVQSEQTALKKRFGGADSKEYIIQAHQRVNEYIESDHDKVMDRIDADIDSASDEGDDKAVERLMEAFKREKAFAHRMKIERTRLARQAKEAPERARAKARSAEAKAEAGQAPSGARPGQF